MKCLGQFIAGMILLLEASAHAGISTNFCAVYTTDIDCPLTESHYEINAVAISDQGHILWFLFHCSADANEKTDTEEGPVNLSPADFSNLTFRIDHLVSTVPPHFYGGVRGWALELRSSRGSKWFAGWREREKSAEIREFELFFQNLALRYLREYLAQHKQPKTSWWARLPVRLLVVFGLCAMLFAALRMWKRSRVKTLATVHKERFAAEEPPVQPR